MESSAFSSGIIQYILLQVGGRGFFSPFFVVGGKWADGQKNGSGAIMFGGRLKKKFVGEKLFFWRNIQRSVTLLMTENRLTGR